jgi:hypothetical protein
VELKEIERIARAVLKELGVTITSLTVTPEDGQPGTFRVDFGGAAVLRVKCGRGSTAQWVRQQIFEQYLSQG